MLRCVYGVLRPAAGVVRLDDADFDLSVCQVVLMGRVPHKRLLDRDDHHDHRLVADALERVGVVDLAQRSYRTLSSGEKQRVLGTLAGASSSRRCAPH